MLNKTGHILAAKLVKAMSLNPGLTAKKIAAECGVTPQAVNGWRTTGRIDKKQIPKLVRLTGYTSDWWLDANPESPPEVAPFVAARAGTLSAGNTDPGPQIKGRVPLISWVQAGDWSAVVDNFQPGTADEWIETTVPIHQHTYALRVKGDSMTNPAGVPSFPHGIIIIVEPDMEAVPGSYVVVRQNGDAECTFKQLIKDAGQLYLKPLNPAYPLMRLADDAVICGVVREATMRFF